MFSSILNIFSYWYPYPLVTALKKRSIMGHKHHKTFDYYRNKDILTPMDEKFTINYKSYGKEYKLYCNTDTYERALCYIKNSPNPFYTRKVLYAFERLENGFIFDLTQKVLMGSGPDSNFYINTEFPVRCNYLCKNVLYIVSTDLKVYKFADEDIIDISSENPNFTSIF